MKEHPEMVEALREYEQTGRVPNPKKRANFTIDSKLLKNLEFIVTKRDIKCVLKLRNL